MGVDLRILEKYGRPGPRYTSYPTALQFTGDFGQREFERAIVESNRSADGRDLSLYFHFPFCESLCYYCGCNMQVTRNRDYISDYLRYLKREIDLLAELVNTKRRVVQVHWGGGTPTYLTTAEIADVAAHIANRFRIASGAEVSIEIDPRCLTEDHLRTIRRSGFNRVSFGVQDFNREVQEAVNRIQPESLTRRAVAEARELGFESINVDLIYGLPFQTVDTYRETIDKIIDIAPDRLAVFNYAHVPWMKKHQALIPEEAIPRAGERLKILKLVIERFTDSGYVYIGMDHFARPDDELAVALGNHTLRRNFQGYTTHANLDIYAMGVSSISELRDVYAQNTKTISDYKLRIDRGEIPTTVGCRLDDDDRLRRYVIQELMCNSRIMKADIREKFDVDFDSYFVDSIKQLDEFVNDGLVTKHADRLQVEQGGRLVVRNIAMAFDRYLSGDMTKKYSRTV